MTERPSGPIRGRGDRRRVYAARGRDNCGLLDEFTDAELADQLTAVWAERIGEADFERLVDVFARLRSE